MNISRSQLRRIIREELQLEVYGTLQQDRAAGRIQLHGEELTWGNLKDTLSDVGEFLTGLDFEVVKAAFESGEAEQIADALWPLVVTIGLTYTGLKAFQYARPVIMRIGTFFGAESSIVQRALQKINGKVRAGAAGEASGGAAGSAAAAASREVPEVWTVVIHRADGPPNMFQVDTQKLISKGGDGSAQNAVEKILEKNVRYNRPGRSAPSEVQVFRSMEDSYTAQGRLARAHEVRGAAELVHTLPRR